MKGFKLENGQTLEASAWTKFRLLMWKNFLQQWRHPVQTAAELLIPILTMSLVLVLRSQIEPSTEDVISYPPIPAHTFNYSLVVLGGMNLTQMSVAYSPRSEVLENVVSKAVANLVIENIKDAIPIIIDLIPILPDIELPPDILNNTIIEEIARRIIPVSAYDNSSELETIYGQEEATRRVIAAIEFDDSLFGATELPSDLSFALRFPERPRLNSFFGQGSRTWRSDLVFPAFEIPGPRARSSWEGGRDPGYVNEMFIALQHMVSLELISSMTGANLDDFKVHIQRYPHPPYIQDMAVQVLQYLMPAFIMISFCYTAVNLVRAVTVEKELQLKETMKIMGLPTWLHWTAWLCKQVIYMLIAGIFIVMIWKVNWFTTEDGFSDYSVFTHTPWTVLFFYLTLYFFCTIFFCFMLSSMFSKASTAALFAGVIWFLTYIPSFLLQIDGNISTAVQTITCLSINSAMAYGFQILLAAETNGGIQWGAFMSLPSTESSRFTFGHVLIMLTVDCVLYMLIALYLEQILPGPYGTPKRWNFFLKKQFWVTGSKVNDLNISDNTHNTIQENDPSDLSIGVQIIKLSKKFGENVAVDNLSLNIYDDQITVLLGHNGAGKSTTISMLTGNLEISSGSVTVAGFDITNQSRAARSNIGLCPQHNVLFNELTVREHLEFFSRLKGFVGKQLEYEIDMLISKLELDEKRNYLSGGLSGGQKRRLSVGIALCGAAKVVLLDEPTSGMDPASRRALWDLLQQEKKGRSIILTTHFMDEADILGDRVAILANGRLQCVGSPYFLKQHYGAGYTLVVVKKKGFKLQECTAVINRHIPGISTKEDRGTEVTYSLLNEYSHVFEATLNDLESNIDNIQYKNYGLIATTLEDVFMSVGSDIVTTTDLDQSVATSADSTNGDSLIHEVDSSLGSMASSENLTGIRLICQHVLATWLKLWLVWSRSWQLLLLQVLVPIVHINATLGILQWIVSFAETVQRRILSLIEGFASTETLLNFNGTSTSSLGFQAKSAYEAMFRTADVDTMDLTVIEQSSIFEYYLSEAATKMATMRNTVLIGATFEDSGATAWFSNFGYHDVANSLAAIHKALLQSLNPAANLTVYNHPLQANYADQTDLNTYVSFLSMELANGIGTSLGVASAVFIMFYIKERVSRAKLLQKAAGIQPAVMWGSAAIFDWLWFCIICIPILISCLIFNVTGLSTGAELGRAYLCMIIYGAAMLPIKYVMSYFFNGPAVGFVSMFFINVLFGMMGSQIVQALYSDALDTHDIAEILDRILQFFPLYSLVTSIRILCRLGLTKWSCLQNCQYLASVLPNMQECTLQVMCENFAQQCCIPENPWFVWGEDGVLRYLTIMLVTLAFMWAVLMIAEYRLVQKVFNRTRVAPTLDESTMDSDVVDEMRHVEQIGSSLTDSMVAKKLTKYYGKHLAVDQVSFTVGDTECFGLLGVNGAGKTTTFKMLMGDESISSGDALISGHSVKTNITRVYENIGYCPQFDAVFNELTGRETMRLFSMLRGFEPGSYDLQSEALAHSLGFYKHFDKRVQHYSGGNKRKLSTAVALLGRTRLVFVDEPTTGVDPAAKRQVWTAIRSARRSGRGVVLTSHSMEECEALCSRLTIMVNGRFQCLGTPQHLKNKFSEGFTLTVKMKVDERSLSVSAETSDAVKAYISSNFTNPKIMEEYQGLLTYYLPDKSVAWSQMFGIMETAKRELGVEDYSISQTTLEQIFLQFTKYQKEGL